MQTKPLQDTIVSALKSLKALDIAIIDLRKKTIMTDKMIICTGSSSRHVKSIAGNVIKNIKEKKLTPLSVEGQKEGEWILIDLANVIVHVMQQSARDFYSLEELWGKIDR